MLLGRIELVLEPQKTSVFCHLLTFSCEQLCSSFPWQHKAPTYSLWERQNLMRTGRVRPDPS